MYFFILALLLALFTRPSFATEMRYPAGEEPIELPAHSLLNAQLPRAAQSQEDKKLGAMSLYLTLMREDGSNVWAPYQLAASSAEKGQTELAERYLQLSANRGLWYYYALLEDDAFNSIQHRATYQSILAATKARYLRHAPLFEGKASYAIPDGTPPAGGWPIVVFLHGYGKGANISPEERLLFSEMGVAYIEINGTQMLSENSFRWSNYSEESTQNAIQQALRPQDELQLNPQKIYLAARGQGALHAANLLSKYPQFYAGAMLIAPNGEIKPAQQSLAANKKVVVAYYDRQNFSEQALALHFANLFSENNQVETLHFPQGENAEGGWQARFKRPLQWVLNQAPDAKPGV
ncbi:alpha/beta hydrolase [Serratia sp. TSA_198.1]|uniref:alpha/beta hydrolase n=1 Tax=Serratia sp. TSA_198.1 TaxID=3415664 RepID=UPI0040457E70